MRYEQRTEKLAKQKRECEKMAKARIIKGAPETFMKRARQIYKNMPLPKTYQDFYHKLCELEGTVLEIDREYNDRIVLRYTEDLIIHNPDGTTVIGIDLEKDLTERV